MRKYNLPVFIPHRGCPFDCTFCNQRKITGVETDVTADYVRNIIGDFLKTTKKENSTTEVAFFGGSFTGMDLSVQEEFLKVAAEFGTVIDGIRLSTRPDYITTEVIALLKRYNVAVIPGSAFGECGDGYIRASYCYSVEHIEEALRRIELFINELKG